MALSVLREPMFLLLAAAAGLYLLVGDLGEGLMLAGFAGLTIGLVAVQEARSERALAALRALGAPMARVLREGVEMRIAAAEVVRGDWLLVDEGERVAADAVVRQGDALSVDESLLTGESMPVSKSPTPAAAPGNDIGGDASAWVFSGTLVVRGHGIAEVVHTGTNTQAGRIGVSLATLETAPTPLQQNIGRLVRTFGIGALILSLFLVALYGVLRGNWMEGALAGIAFAMAMLPEEFPMVLTVFLALGAWRMSRLHVLVRRPAVIETLGALHTVCLDKTGTLTQNRMRVGALVTPRAHWAPDNTATTVAADCHSLLAAAVLASHPSAVDPMDRALVELGGRTLQGPVPLPSQTLFREFGLSDRRPMVVQVWDDVRGTRVAAAKGAPEAVAAMCKFDDAARALVARQVDDLANQGMRVLGVASGALDTALALADDTAHIALDWLGLVAFEDPLRKSAPAAIARLREAHIEAAMMTGDLPQTALAIASLAGIDTSGGVVTGAAIDAMDATALAACVAQVRVFARVRPEQKLRLIEAFKSGDRVVGMTGDGVNDAPALKSAHVGIAMGARATDVARESAAIVLLDDDLGHLVDGVREGRRIFGNLRRAMTYIVAIHVPIAGLALVPVLLGLPPLMLPAHVVLVEMVIDPVCSIAFEGMPSDAGAANARPRDPRAPILGLARLALAALQGALVLGGALAVFAWTQHIGASTDGSRALTFVALTAANLVLVRVNATAGLTLPHLLQPGFRAYWTIAGISVGIVSLCLWWEPLASLFQFEPPSLAAAAMAVLVGATSALSFDVVKAWLAHRRGPPGGVAPA